MSDLTIVPDGWQKRSLISLADYVNGYSFGPSDWAEDGRLIIKIEQLNNPNAKGARFSGDISPAYHIVNGDLIFSWSATLKAEFWKGEPGVLNQHLFKVIPNSDVNISLLQKLLEFYMDELAAGSQGSTMKHITRAELIKFHVVLPIDKDEQQKIAKILSTVDNLIEKTQTLIDKYTAIKQGMMADLFTRGIDLKTGQLRPSVEDAPELYKQTELGWVPKEWEVVLLDDISLRGSGHTPSKSFPEYWNGGIKWVSLADSKKLDNLYIHETDNNISDLGLQNSSATKHPKGTVILSRDAGIGKSAILAEEMAVSQHFMAWRCGSVLDNYFLYFWLQNMKPNFNAIAMGSTIPTIGLDYFKRLKIAVPKDIKEQVEIGKRLLKIFEKNVTLKAEKKKYELIKKGLMQDLLTGEVRVN